MIRSRFGAAVAALALLVAAGAVRADDEKKDTKDKLQPPPRQRPGFPGLEGPGGGSLLAPADLDKLDLSKEQKEKVEKLVKDFETKQKASAAKMRKLSEEAREGGPDKRREIGPKMRELFESNYKARTAAEGKLKEVLNEEQKKKFEEIQKSRPRFPGGPGGPFGPGPGGPFGPGPGFRAFAPGQILPSPVQDVMKFTKEQKADLAKLQKEVDEKLAKILTDEQKKILEMMKSGGGPPRIRPGVPPERRDQQ